MCKSRTGAAESRLNLAGADCILTVKKYYQIYDQSYGLRNPILNPSSAQKLPQKEKLFFSPHKFEHI